MIMKAFANDSRNGSSKDNAGIGFESTNVVAENFVALPARQKESGAIRRCALALSKMPARGYQSGRIGVLARRFPLYPGNRGSQAKRPQGRLLHTRYAVWGGCDRKITTWRESWKLEKGGPNHG